MRRVRFFLIALLIVVMGSGAVFAQRDTYGYLEDVQAIAWLDGEELNVAVGNTNNRPLTLTIMTSTLDSRGRPVFASRQVTVPARTIVQEVFYPGVPRRNEEIEVRISEGYRSFRVRVQHPGVFEFDSYVVQANTEWTATVDLDLLLDGSGKTRIVIDDYYTTADGSNQARIRIDSIGGGPSQVKGTNTIEYVKPYLVLKMKTPNEPWLTTMTFGLRKVDTTSTWRQERIEGPTVLVYGRNMRFAGASSGGSGRIIAR